VTFLLT